MCFLYRYACLGYFNVPILSVPMSGPVPVHGLATHRGVLSVVKTHMLMS